MDGRIIFLIVAIVVLIATCIIHFFCTQPIDFQDWFIGESAWVWIIGTIIFFAVIYGFVFWSWWIMLTVVLSLIVLGVIIGTFYYLQDTRKERKAKRRKKEEESFESNIYNSIKKLMRYPNISSDFDIEKYDFKKFLNLVRKQLDMKFLDVKRKLETDINQGSYLQLKDFTNIYNTEISEFEELLRNKRQKHEDVNQLIINFFSQKYDYINEILLSINEDFYKAFMAKKGKVITKKVNALQIYDNLPEYLIEAVKNNIQPYIDLFQIENFLRIYINIKYYKKYGNYELENLFKNAQNAQKKAFSRIKEDEKQGWKIARGKTIIFYVDFSELSGLIVNNTNWELFKEDFKNQDFIKLRINELYEMRNKVAHNSVLSYDEIANATAWCNQIYNQLSNYKTQIKTWKV